jgi:hypothetical protein
VAEERSIPVLAASGLAQTLSSSIGQTNDKIQANEAEEIDRAQRYRAAAQERLRDDGKQIETGRSGDFGVPDAVLAIAVDLCLRNVEDLILDDTNEGLPTFICECYWTCQQVRTRYGKGTDLFTARNQTDNGSMSAAAPARDDATILSDAQEVAVVIALANLATVAIAWRFRTMQQSYDCAQRKEVEGLL